MLENISLFDDEGQAGDTTENENENQSPQEYIKNEFGCCSRYYECSNAKKCLIAEQKYAKGCLYRRKLESGIIYYGKNATGFSEEEYETCKCKVYQLPDALKNLYVGMVIMFCGGH